MSLNTAIAILLFVVSSIFLIGAARAVAMDIRPAGYGVLALGRLGGLVGGKRRAKKLSKKRRSEIARRAAQARWGQR